jgi:hypothetical protein
MKKLTTIVALAIVIALIAPPAEAAVKEQADPPQQPYTSIIEIMIEMKKQDKKLQMQNRITELKQYANKTWYVFSGSTPRGWDCSGLVKWFYSDFGIELEHSATKQMHLSQITTEPVPGDIIFFSRNGGKTAYHNGIYLGNDMYIHAPRPGRKTTISSIYTIPESHWVFKKLEY